MFENIKPFEQAARAASAESLNALGARVGSNDATLSAAPHGTRAGDALRAIEWTELTARLNAARDLRRELRRDALLCAGSSGASFGDAAESFFKGVGYSERPVNPDALEGRKALSRNVFEREGNAATGDARDEQ